MASEVRPRTGLVASEVTNMALSFRAMAIQAQSKQLRFVGMICIAAGATTHAEARV